MKALSMFLLAAWFVSLRLFSPVVAQEPLTDAKRADILRLLQVTGSGQMGLQFAEALIMEMTNTMKAANPDVPPRVAVIVKEEVTKLMQQRLSALLEGMVPLYHEHFTHEEIKGLLQFYSTALGKKVIQRMPAVMQQSMAVGQAWGESLNDLLEERVRKRLEAEGIK